MPKIKVSAGFAGKIPTGSFQNSSPSFSAEVEFTVKKGDLPGLVVEIDKAQKTLHDVCYRNFTAVAEAAKLEKIKNDMRGFRFYKTERGEYPSVTTILDPDFKAWCTDEELRIAVAEGNINHARAAHFIETGKWVEPKDLAGVAPDLLACKGRDLDIWDFPAFLKKYPLAQLKNGRRLVNDAHRYAGTNDAECLFEDVQTIIDFKRTPDREKNFTQMAAYAKCPGMEHIKQMMIIPCNPDNQQGFSKPIVSPAIDKYFEVFLDKRRRFEAAYGV